MFTFYQRKEESRKRGQREGVKTMKRRGKGAYKPEVLLGYCQKCGGEVPKKDLKEKVFPKFGELFKVCDVCSK